MTISIVIPNYNGEKLLEKNLPNILESGASEILIVDDASSDNSKTVLERFQKEHKKLKVIIHQKNKGFIYSVNELFKEASGDIVVALNNDVWVEKDFLKPIEVHFKDPKTFAVTLHEEGEGPSVSFWKNGFYEFKRGIEAKYVQKSAWASGGSAAYSKKIWNQLNGFDKIFVPFYWEDTDISFRAIKAGFNVFWEPESKVKHYHETTIKKYFNAKYIAWVQQRNQLLFIWKNITDKNLINEHRKNLAKRLFKVGYWIPFLWALSKYFSLKKIELKNRNDLEAINYVSELDISVISVTFNNADNIKEYVNSVLEALPKNGELIILDNASIDETINELEKFGDKIKLIKSSANLGFSKGNNKAAKEVNGRYLLFLNPDTKITPDTISRLISYIKDKPEVGILTPQLLENNHIQPSVRKLPTLTGAIKEYLFNKPNAYEPYVPEENSPTEVECVYGAAMLIKKDIFKELNGFDERYFLYYEDVDLCKRVRELGFKIIYDPEIQIRHLVGQSATKIDKLSWGIRTLAWFIPFKRFGSRYYQFKGSDIYHGVVTSYLIRILIYLSIKFKIYQPKEVVTF